MKVLCENQDVLNNSYDGIVLFSYEDGSDAETKLKAKLGASISLARDRKEFEGKTKQVLFERQAGMPRYIVLVGLGKRSEVSIGSLRLAAAMAAEQLRNAGAKSIAYGVPAELDREQVAQALVEGSVLRSYQFNAYKTQKLNEIKEITTVGLLADNELSAIVRGAQTGQIIAESTNMVRDLQNTPSCDMTPKDIVNVAEKVARDEKIKIDILDSAKLRKLGYEGILSVGRGSANSPYLVAMEYAPKGAKRTIVVVGKGITFDTGGISIKPADKMGDMKFDMSGAAVVIGILRNASKLKLPVRVIGVLCLAENMPDGGAYKPGDVIRTKNGKTIEIDNTDAEGRIVLSDGLYHASTFSPDAIIDVATLTGAMVVTLGDVGAGVMGNNQELIDKLVGASMTSGERLWQLPMWDEYAEDIKSSIADMKNTGAHRMSGSIAGAMMLREFVGTTPWAHLDIAGVAWTQGRERYFTSAGGTGYSVRLLTEYLKNL